jgi:hypothetical protein
VPADDVPEDHGRSPRAPLPNVEVDVQAQALQLRRTDFRRKHHDPAAVGARDDESPRIHPPCLCPLALLTRELASDEKRATGQRYPVAPPDGSARSLDTGSDLRRSLVAATLSPPGDRVAHFPLSPSRMASTGQARRDRRGGAGPAATKRTRRESWRRCSSAARRPAAGHTPLSTLMLTRGESAHPRKRARWRDGECRDGGRRGTVLCRRCRSQSPC